MGASAKTRAADVMTMDRLANSGAAGWAGDVDRLTSFMAGDCEFHASVGTGPGTVFQGRDEVRRGFELRLAYDEGAEAARRSSPATGGLAAGLLAHHGRRNGHRGPGI